MVSVNGDQLRIAFFVISGVWGCSDAGGCNADNGILLPDVGKIRCCCKSMLCFYTVVKGFFGRNDESGRLPKME